MLRNKRLGPIWGPAFCPVSWVIWRKGHHRKDGNDPLPPSGYEINSFLSCRYFPSFRWWFIHHSQTTYEGRSFGAVLGGQNRKNIIEKTRVGFGRTELSLRLSCTEFCALSSGHGPRGRGFEGGGETLDFHDLFWGVKNGKNTWKCRMNMVRFWSPELSTLAKWSPKNSRKCPGAVTSKKYLSRELSKKFGALGVADFQSIAEIEWIPHTKGWAPHFKN